MESISRIARTVALAALFVTLSIAASNAALAQTDTLTIGQVTATGTSQTNIKIPIYLADVSGTTIGLDKAPTNAFNGQSLYFQWADPCVAASSAVPDILTPPGILADDFNNGYILFNTEAGTVNMSTHWLLSVADQTPNAPTQFYPTTQPPSGSGDLLGFIKVTLTNCTAGAVIPIAVSTTTGETSQFFAPSNATESCGGGVAESGLTCVAGSITIPGAPGPTNTPTSTPTAPAGPTNTPTSTPTTPAGPTNTPTSTPTTPAGPTNTPTSTPTTPTGPTNTPTSTPTTPPQATNTPTSTPTTVPPTNTPTSTPTPGGQPFIATIPTLDNRALAALAVLLAAVGLMLTKRMIK